MRTLLRLAGLLAVGAALLAGLWRHDTRLPLRPAGAPALGLQVLPGMSADAIGRELWSLGLVRHPLVFRALVWRRGAGGRLRAGRYAVEGGLTLEQLVDKLEKGEAERHDVTVPEGKSLEEVAALVAQKGVPAAAFLAAARDPAPIRDLDPDAPDLEGYLFPDTYDTAEGPEAARALVQRMADRFRSVVAPHLPRLAAAGLSVRQLVTLASLVELETGRGEERPRIAAVFRNRLEKGMLLQADPTVIYALRKQGRYDGNIRKRDLELDSPYNTYRYPGLPPGPIASPGRASLLAAVEPAASQELYFVSRNDGTHEFSESLQKHERAVERYQKQRPSAARAPALPAPPR